MHVEAAGAAAVGHLAEGLDDRAVARVVGDQQVGLERGRQGAAGRQRETFSRREPGGLPPQLAQHRPERGDVGGRLGLRLDLVPEQLGLDLVGAAPHPPQHPGRVGGGGAGLGVDEEQLLLHPHLATFHDPTLGRVARSEGGASAAQAARWRRCRRWKGAQPASAPAPCHRATWTTLASPWIGRHTLGTLTPWRRHAPTSGASSRSTSTPTAQPQRSSDDDGRPDPRADRTPARRPGGLGARRHPPRPRHRPARRRWPARTAPRRGSTTSCPTTCRTATTSSPPTPASSGGSSCRRAAARRPASAAGAGRSQLYAAQSGGSTGIGDLADLRTLREWTEREGGRFLVLNPLHAVAPGHPQEASPYLPATRRFRNPLYLRVDDAGRLPPGAAPVDRDAAWDAKLPALRADLRPRPGPTPAFTAWRAERGRALEEWALWSVLALDHGQDWHDWPAELQRPARPRRAGRAPTTGPPTSPSTPGSSGGSTSSSREATGDLTVVQDLPVGVHGGGADAWVWQDVMAGGATIGCPPDALNTVGQDWGSPPLVPWRLRAAGYQPFVESVRATIAGAGGLRVDHVMGLFRLWWIPEGEHPADGCYVRYPADDLLDIVCLESHRAGAVVVGEDLGTVEDGVREALAERGILGYRVLWFEDDDPADVARARDGRRHHPRPADGGRAVDRLRHHRRAREQRHGPRRRRGRPRGAAGPAAPRRPARRRRRRRRAGRRLPAARPRARACCSRSRWRTRSPRSCGPTCRAPPRATTGGCRSRCRWRTSSAPTGRAV